MPSPAATGFSLVSSIGHLPPESIIFGRSASMDAVRRKVEKVAATNLPVLISGESGTGKEVLASLLHRWSPWSEGPFVKVCCPAIPSALLESELFGYERGAFTGAYGAKPGRFEMAHTGTLFLDEIAELDPGLQAKLLQVLQDGQFCRIGAQEDKKVEARVVCATNRRLDKEIQGGSFRHDLFYRINVVSICLAPLRERSEDIQDLANYFMECYSALFTSSVRPLSAAMVEHLKNYTWPGNIRQLENLIKRYVILGSEEAILSDLAPPSSGPFEPELPPNWPESWPISLKKVTRKVVDDLERKIILRALQSKRWNKKEAAKVLNISYRALLYKIRQSSGAGSEPAA